MEIEILSQFREGLVVFDRGKCHLLLKCESFIPTRSFCLDLLLACCIKQKVRKNPIVWSAQFTLNKC